MRNLGEKSGCTHEWVNWFGNQTCSPARVEKVHSELAVQDAVARAEREGLSIRPFASGHSLTGLVPGEGVLLTVSPSKEVTIDHSNGTAQVSAGHTMEHVAKRLWDAGLAMPNLGELKKATLIGAASTGVHGTGLGLPCVANSVQSVRIVTADGSVKEISAADGDYFRAARMSLGMLGVITEVTISTQLAHNLYERSFFCSPDQLAEQWGDLLDSNRHLSFFYIPDVTAIQHHATVVPQIMATLSASDEDTGPLNVPTDGDTCLVTVREKIALDGKSPQLGPGERFGAMDDILMYDFHEPYREIEFGVPFEISARVFLELRRRVQSIHPDYNKPMLVRFAAQDDSLLSWFHSGPKATFSVVDDTDAPYEGILADFERFFDSHRALPHWGKEHRLDKARLRKLQPGYPAFQDIRQELDPMGTFLNSHLRALFI